MKHCSNPLCPRRVTTGEAARFEPEHTRCTECRGALSEAAAPAARTPGAPPVADAPEGIFHRVAITLGCVGAFVLADLGRVPGVVLRRPEVSLLGLYRVDGLLVHHAVAPMCMGFLLAAIAARALGPRRTLNVERTAWWIALAASFVFTLTEAPGSHGGFSGAAFDWRFVTGLAAMFGLAGMITRQGVVNGVGALLGAWALDSMGRSLLRAQGALADASLSWGAALVWALALVALVALTLWALGSSEGTRARIVTPDPSSETAYRASSTRTLEVTVEPRTPVAAGDALMVFPLVAFAVVMVCQLFKLGVPGWAVAGPSHLGYCLAYFTVTLGAVVALARAFNPPTEVAQYLAQATGIEALHAPLESVRDAVHLSVARSVGFLVVVTLLGWLQELVTHGVLGDQARVAVILSAVGLDVIQGLRLQNTLGPIGAVRSERRMYGAELVRALLGAYGIPATISGRQYRTLHPFIGTVGTIDVSVAALRTDEALAALEDARTPARHLSVFDIN